MQTDGRSPAADAAVTSSEASSQGVRRCLAWWGGRGCRDGASWRLGEAWGGRWPRWFSSAAAGAFGEENRGGGERSGEREERGTGRVGGLDGCVALGRGIQRRRRQPGREEVAGARGRARRARARPPGKIGRAHV